MPTDAGVDGEAAVPTLSAPATQGPANRAPTWGDDLPAWAVVAVASMAVGFACGWRTRPMGDSASYRDAAVTIFGGWHRVTDRTPGYPTLLWLTGSTRGETTALFVAQLALHALAVVLVVRSLGHLGVDRRLRTTVAVLLVAPAPLLAVVYAQSEALSAALLATGLWCFVRWTGRAHLGLLVGLGVTLGIGVWVRPAYVALIVPVAAVVAWTARPRRRVRTAVAVSAPAVALAGILLLVNVARFDMVGLTPLAGWYLGSRTSTFVERLDDSWEPARSILVRERDRQLLLGDRVDAPNYAFAVREELARATGRSGLALDRYMLRLNLHLIARHPFEYESAVAGGVDRYLDMNTQPAITGLGRPVAWGMALFHTLLVALVLACAAVVAGTAWAGLVERRTMSVWLFGATVALTVFLVSIATETGAARLRTPTDPLLLAMTAVGIGIAARSRRRPNAT